MRLAIKLAMRLLMRLARRLARRLAMRLARRLGTNRKEINNESICEREHYLKQRHCYRTKIGQRESERFDRHTS